MPVKTVIDGNLLADCQRHGQVRFGMFRGAEEITKRLLDDTSLELFIANTRQTTEDDRLLRDYIPTLHADKKPSILSYPS